MGMKQIKHFNQNYQELRQLGKVAIGRRARKLKAARLSCLLWIRKENLSR